MPYIALVVGRAVGFTVRWGMAPTRLHLFLTPTHPRHVGKRTMHLLYIDGSGTVKNPNETYFVLAGVSVFERQIYHIIKEVDEFVRALGLDDSEAAELHASDMASGKARPWKTMPRSARIDIIKRALDILSGTHRSVRLFAVAVHKQAVAPQDPVEYAFEEICNRFDLKLRRKWVEEKHRGLVIMDKSHYENTLQNLAQGFRESGTRWGKLRNLAEVPLFVDSRMSRIVQLADLVAWAVWRRYEKLDTGYFDRIVSRFDSEGGVIHGLVHYKPRDEQCHCPACMSRFTQRE